MSKIFSVLTMLALGVTFGSAAETPADTSAWPLGPRDTLIKPEVESLVAKLLGTMTLEEKVGQMVQADIASISPQDLHDYKLGSVLAGGDSAPDGDPRAAPAAWLALVDSLARAALADATPAHPAIPLIFGIDAVHGHAHVRGATIFPHNVGLGAAHDAALVRRIGVVTAAEVAATGMDWTFAPTIAVVRDVRWGRSYESYSEDPQLVASYAGAIVNGVQGAMGTADFMSAGHTLCSVKHFLGDGGTIDGRDQANNNSTLAELIRVHGAGYPPALAAGALTVMASYNSWHDVKMHDNHALITEALKGRMGFNGFVVGDWNAQEEIPGCTKYDCAAAIMAGIDMIMAPDSWKAFYHSTLAHVRAGDISQARIDDAVRRILRVKALAGLFTRPLPAQRPDAGHFEQFGSAEHRAVAREAVRKSLVLLKNNGGVLPLNPHSRILVAGGAADDIGTQVGGWSIDWQADHNTNADFPGATSLYAGLRNAVEAAGGTISLSRDGQFKQRPDAAIVIFGEAPYAEFAGDRETLAYATTDTRDLQLLLRLHQRGIPVIGVFLSGRPMWVNREINATDAFVAAWLPGGEGAGLADVLLRGPDGVVRYDFTGRLSFSWPATAMPVRFGAADEVLGAQFPRGYGLDYAHPLLVDKLPEIAGVAPDRHPENVLFANGRVTAPWSVSVIDDTGQVRLTTSSQVTPTRVLTVSRSDSGLSAVWSGGQRGELQIGEKPHDLRALAQGGTAIRLRVRVDQRPDAPVWMGLGCTTAYGAALAARRGGPPLPVDGGKSCGASKGAMFDITQQLQAAPVGSTQTVELPLACAQKRGADLSLVSPPFALMTKGSLGLTLFELSFTTTKGAKGCPKG